MVLKMADKHAGPVALGLALVLGAAVLSGCGEKQTELGQGGSEISGSAARRG